MPEAPGLLHDWLAAAAADRPQGPAIVEDGVVLTLQGLVERSASLATAFRQLGLEDGDRVALLMEKSADSITALFATLAAGGAYVPIQPDWPQARVDTVLADCDARLLVREADPTSGEAATVVDRRSGRTLSWLECLAKRPQLAGVGRRAPDDPAFILFTSGSTGVPKGVTISHRAVGAFVRWSARQFRLSHHDRILCPSPLSFDLSTLDVFGIAASGSTCIVATRGAVLVPRLLVELAREQAATVWYSVPSLLMRMLEKTNLERQPLTALRLILFAGEAMPASEAARLRSVHPRAELYNLYGPTETNVVTWYHLPSDLDPARTLSIGQPCSYARVRLEADSEENGGQACGTGEKGLLLVAGESLMSGYWNRPQETARSFVTLEDEDGPRRYYRTGDRAVQQPDGTFLFTGRADRQVKRRGYRIELGDIEAALGSHPALAEVAVVASAGHAVRVTAVTRGRGASVPSELDLRAHCARLLPPYMIPDRFVQVQEIPRSHRGKIDYAALGRLFGEAS